MKNAKQYISIPSQARSMMLGKYAQITFNSYILSQLHSKTWNVH